ncbi:hypothetical protein [Sinobaca sp. H24]|uniref:hypothetical protein n=1 Tax=Sinobaca sp. H24 TaxID=2923376 RepID=UPI00207AD73A|nr:hypothetical protein [Sinobaca sp. H24]
MKYAINRYLYLVDEQMLLELMDKPTHAITAEMRLIKRTMQMAGQFEGFKNEVTKEMKKQKSTG